MTKHDRVALAAVNTWGVESQLLLAVEEAGELVQALAKYVNKRGGSTAVIDEIADVSIVLDQLNLIFDSDAIRVRKEFKIERLRGRLNL